MDEDRRTCQLFGVIRDLLDSDRHLVNSLELLFDTKKPVSADRRSPRASVLIELLQEAFDGVDPARRCHLAAHSAAPSSYICHCPLIWPSVDGDGNGDGDCIGPQAGCDGSQLVRQITERNADFEGFVPNSDGLSIDQRIQLVWLLIPLVFRPSERPASSPVSVSIDQVRSDFQDAFRGSSLRLLQHFIIRANTFTNRDFNYDVIYAKTLPILQSSGTGKTKLVVQLSAFQPGMLVCTRSRDNSLPTSFPPFDESVHAYFKDTLDCKWNSKCLPRAKLFVQHQRLAAWLGSYFSLLASHITHFKEQSGCFDTTGQCLHEDVERCWQTVVYHLALRIHSGTDFIQDYSFEASDQTQFLFCPNSTLHPHAHARAPTPTAFDPDISLGSEDSLTALHHSSTSSASTSHSSLGFRTKILRKVAQMAKGVLEASSQDIPEDMVGQEPGSEPKSKFEVKDTSEDLGTVNWDPSTRATSTSTSSVSDGKAKQRNQPAELASRAAQQHIIPHLEKLEGTLPSDLGRKGKSFFFLAVDEVAIFTELLPVLCRLWRESKPSYTWLLLIDTESSIAHLAGDGVVEASLRLGDDEGKVIVPPFIYLPFDVQFTHRLEHTHLFNRLQSGSITFRQLFDMLRWLGRPLWGTALYRRSLSNDDECYRPHLHNILKKLLYGRLDATRFWPEKSDTGFFDIIMAAAGQRLPLSFVGHQGARFSSSDAKSPGVPNPIDNTHEESMKARLQASRKFLQHQVSSYLRIISDVNRTDSYITATPSEPAVSLAVASEFRGKDSHAVANCMQKWSHVVHVLARAYRSVGMMLGEEGEECVRLLITVAADLVAAERVQRLSGIKKLAADDVALFQAQSDPICLKDWLQTLLDTEATAGWYEVPRDHQTRPGRDVLEWASDYYLNFTHFVKLGLTVLPEQADPKLLVEYWCRQAALYGVQNQHAWDLLIPIYRSTSSAPSWSDQFDPNQLSYVAIQVKNRQTAVTATDRFGPSCWYPEPVPSSAIPTPDTAAASSQNPWPLLLDDCLEIFFDLRGVSGVCLRDFTETRPRHGPKKGRATSANPVDTHEEPLTVLPQVDQGDVPMEETTLLPGDESNVPMEEKPSPSDGATGIPAGQRHLRPNNCLNLVVSGTSASVLRVITYLDEAARKELRLLFAFDDDVLQQNWKRITKECMTARGSAITKEFEEVGLVLHGVGQNHFLRQGPGSTRRPRGATGIPEPSRKGRKRTQPDGGEEAG